MNDLILYTTQDGRSQIKLRADLGTVWLSQLDMAELFQTRKQNVAKHLKAIFAEQELSADAVVNQRLTTAADGKNYRVAHYHLNAILENRTTALYLDYDQRRKQQEAAQADQLNEAELKALENTLEGRPKP